MDKAEHIKGLFEALDRANDLKSYRKAFKTAYEGVLKITRENIAEENSSFFIGCLGYDFVLRSDFLFILDIAFETIKSEYGERLQWIDYFKVGNYKEKAKFQGLQYDEEEHKKIELRLFKQGQEKGSIPQDELFYFTPVPPPPPLLHPYKCRYAPMPKNIHSGL